MHAMCPISFQKINEHAARLTAAWVAAGVVLFLLTAWPWVPVILAADFFLRGFWEPRYSPLASISKKILALLKVQPVTVDAAPKIFAARTGFVFSCLLFVLPLCQLPAAALVVGILFAICALLEAVFRFCLACAVYPLVCKMTAGR